MALRISERKNIEEASPGVNRTAVIAEYVAGHKRLFVLASLPFFLIGAAVAWIGAHFQLDRIIEIGCIGGMLGVVFLLATQLKHKMRFAFITSLLLLLGTGLVVLGGMWQVSWLPIAGIGLCCAGGILPFVLLLSWISEKKPTLYKHLGRVVVGLGCAMIAITILTIAAFFLVPHFSGFSFIGKNVEIIEIDNVHYDQALDDWIRKNYDAAEESFLKAKSEFEQARGRQAKLQLAQLEQKMGALYIEIGRYSESYDLLNSAYTSFRKLRGRRDTLTTLAQGQIALYDLGVGNYDRAIEQLQEAYNASRKANAKLQIMQMLAQAYIQHEDYNKANEIYGRIADFWVSLGRVPFEVNPMLANEYGSLMMAVGRYEDAQFCFQNLIDYWEDNGGGENPTIALVFSNMAVLCSYMEKTQEAAEYADRSIEMYETYYSGGLDLAGSYQVVGGIYQDIDKMDKAREYLAKALEMTLAEVGENHSYTAAIYRSLGLYYKEAGDIEEWIRCNEKAIEILKIILQGESSDAAIAYNNICDAYAEDGSFDKAIDAAEKGIAICKNNAGVNSAVLGHLYLNLAWPYVGLNQLDQAIDCADKGTGIIEKQFSNMSPTLAWAYLTKGQVYCEAGRFAQGDEYMQKALEINTFVYGVDHEKTKFNKRRMDEMRDRRQVE